MGKGKVKCCLIYHGYGYWVQVLYEACQYKVVCKNGETLLTRLLPEIHLSLHSQDFCMSQNTQEINPIQGKILLAMGIKPRTSGSTFCSQPDCQTCMGKFWETGGFTRQSPCNVLVVLVSHWAKWPPTNKILYFGKSGHLSKYFAIPAQPLFTFSDPWNLVGYWAFCLAADQCSQFALCEPTFTRQVGQAPQSKK